MAEFDFAKQKLNDASFDKLLSTLKRSISGYDYDSNLQDGTWLATPTDGVITHNLGVLPRQVVVYSASDNAGTTMALDTWSAITATTITINGAGAFCRVLLNK